MPQLYDSGDEISLRHLPESSDASFSFQIPNSLHHTDLLLNDNDADFFKDASFLTTPGPSRVRHSPPMTLAEVTPGPRTHDYRRPVEPSSPSYSLDARPLLPRLKQMPMAPEREIYVPVPASKPNSPMKPKLKLITSPIKFPTTMGLCGATPATERFETLRAEVEKLAQGQGDFHPTISATNGESTSNGVTVMQESKKTKERERVLAKPAKRTVISGGISKTRSKTTIPTSITLSCKPTSVPQALPPPQPILGHHDPENAGMFMQNPDASICSTLEGGIAERLVMYSQEPMESYRSPLPAQSAPRTRSNPGPTSPQPSRSSPPKDPAPPSNQIQTQSHESDNQHQPFTLSQLSPHKRQTPELQHVLILLSPRSSGPTSKNTSPGSVRHNALVLSPMRPSKKRPSATVPAVINVNADGDTAADAVFDTGCNEPRHVQKRKRETKQPVAAAAAASAALLFGQNVSDVNGAAGSRGGAGADLQGEEALPLGSQPQKEGSNAKVLGSSSGSAGSRATNGSIRPRPTRKVAFRGAAKPQTTGGMRREARAVARAVPRSILTLSSSRPLPSSSSSAAVKPQAPPPAPRAGAKDQEFSMSAAVSNLGHETGTLTSWNDNVVGNNATLAVESSKPGVHSTTARTAGRSERHKKEHVTAAAHPTGFKFHLDARKAEYQALAAESTASRSRLQHSKLSSISTASSKTSSSSSSSRAGYRKENVAPTVTVPVPFDFRTAFRAESRAHFDEWAREREREREREEEERRRGREEQEEREIKEMRKRAVPKANEVPGWYKDAPRRK